MKAILWLAPLLALSGCEPQTAEAVWRWIDGPGFEFIVAAGVIAFISFVTFVGVIRLIAWWEGPRPESTEDRREEGEW